MRPLREANSILGDVPPLSHGLRSVTAVREICPPDAQYGTQNLQALTLFLTESGHATVYADGVPFAHQPGSLVLLARGTQMTEIVGANGLWSVRYLLFEGPLADAVEESLRVGDESGCRVFLPVPTPWRDAFFAVMQETARGSLCNPWALLSWCSELLGAIVLGESRTGVAALLTPHGVRRAAERLLERHPERFWSVQEMADALTITPRPFDRRFEIGHRTCTSRLDASATNPRRVSPSGNRQLFRHRGFRAAGFCQSVSFFACLQSGDGANTVRVSPTSRSTGKRSGYRVATCFDCFSPLALFSHPLAPSLIGMKEGEPGSGVAFSRRVNRPIGTSGSPSFIPMREGARGWENKARGGETGQFKFDRSTEEAL